MQNKLQGVIIIILEGKVWKYSDNVDTDIIIPGRYLNTSNPEELKSHCMEEIDPEFSHNVKSGDMIVAGKNFGCGSSREHAPMAIKASGVSCIIARSFARIFYRNAINIGLPILEIDEAEQIKQGDVLKVDLARALIVNTSSGIQYQAILMPLFLQDVFRYGGLINYVAAKKTLII